MKALCLFSGGLDSTTLLWWMLRHGDEIDALSVGYGQRHYVELERAQHIAKLANVKHHELYVPALGKALSGNALTDTSVAVPNGHYEEESMRVTLVPNRNMILLSVAAGMAMSLECGALGYAAHAGDNAIYPDCRPEFIKQVAKCLTLSMYEPVDLVAPFADMSKADVCKLGASLGAPLELTWSCYKGGKRHCGKCGTCTERQEAFVLAGVWDRTQYESPQ